jgi:hypothetical protein
MAVTAAIVKRNRAGNGYEAVVDITGPASYTTGGELLTAAQQATLMPELGGVQALDMSKATMFTSERDSAGRQLVLDKTNNKMMFFAAGAEVPNATNLSAVTIRCRIVYGLAEPF